MRKPIIAGNWKMNKTPQEAQALIKELIPLVQDAACTVVVCVPFVNLETVKQAIAGTNIALGAQNMHWKEQGAYTGEVSAEMLLAVGASYVIIGHSERRQYFAETDETVNQKTKKAVDTGLIPIVCVGESLAERELSVTVDVVTRQTTAALAGLSAAQVRDIVIAYEPVWAIGTGRTATDEQANETIGVIRAVIADLFGQETAQAVRIQYGGSMNPKNAHGLMEQPEIDGGLIGGASLIAQDFASVVHFER